MWGEYRRQLEGPKLRRTEKEIIDALRELHGQGIEMSNKGVGGADIKIYQTARKKFGSLEAALERAGLEIAESPAKSIWSDKEIIAEIRRLHDAGEDLSYTKMFSKHQKLTMAAAKRYKPWGKTLAEAGLDPDRFRVRFRRSDADLIEELRRLYESGEPVNARALRQGHSSLASLLRLRFGSHDAALRVAGLDPTEIRLK